MVGEILTIIPIAVKTAVTNSSKSSLFNSNRRIPNDDYVTMLPSMFDSLNLQSNQEGFQIELERIRVAIKAVKSSFSGFLFVLSKR